MKFIVLFLCLLCFSCQKDFDYQEKGYPYLMIEAPEVSTESVLLKAKISNYRPNWISESVFVWGDAYGIEFSQVGTLNDAGEMTALITSDMDKGETYFLRAYVKTATHTVYSGGLSITSQMTKTPEIVGLFPHRVYDNDLVTLYGRHFSRKQDNTKVIVNGKNADILSYCADSIVFKMPKSSDVGQVDLVVRMDEYRINVDDSLFVYQPYISHLSSSTARSGQILELYGAHLTGNSSEYRIRCTPIGESSSNSREAKVVEARNEMIRFVVPEAEDLCAEVSFEINYSNGAKACDFSDTIQVTPYWTQKAKFPYESMSRLRSFSYQGCGYVLYSDLHKYDPASDTWSKVSNSRPPEYHKFRAEYIKQGDYFFVMGGYDYTNFLRTLMAYDIAANTWTVKQDIPFVFSRLAYAQIGKDVYVITDRCEVWKCDFINEKYTQLNMFQSMVDYTYFGAFVVDGQMYLKASNKTYKYNKASDTWTFVCNDEFDRGSYYYDCSPLFSLNGTGYYMNEGEKLYRFDPIEGVWIAIVSFPYSHYPVYKSTSFTIDDKAYIAVTNSTYQPKMYMFQ